MAVAGGVDRGVEQDGVTAAAAVLAGQVGGRTRFSNM
jgi:hypothetical protein